MEFTAHATAKRRIDNLVLAHPRDAAELLADHVRGVVIPVAGQVFDGDFGVGKRRLYQGLNLIGRHRHRVWSFYRVAPSIQDGKKRSCAARRAEIDIEPPSGSVKSCPPEVPSRTADIPAASAVRTKAEWSGTASR